MEKKVEVEINGRIVRVMPHLVADLKKFGATSPQVFKKDIPIELRKPIVKPVPNTDPLPVMQITNPIEVKPKVTRKRKL